MRIWSTKRLFPGILLIFLFACPVFGQNQMEPDSLRWNDWNFRISPYAWLIGFQGELYRPPSSSLLPEPPPPQYDIDIGFRDIRNSIKFIMMLGGQFRGKNWVAQFNSSSLIIESEVITPADLLLQDNIIRLTYWGGDFEVGYRLIKGQEFEMDALVGLKFVHFGLNLRSRIGGNLDVQGARSKAWTDPALGFNFRYNPNRKISFTSYADVSIPAIGTDNSLQFIGVAQYHFTRTFYTSIGYRYYNVEIPEEEAIFNGSLKGLILHMGFQF
jgi:hypothetical protein